MPRELAVVLSGGGAKGAFQVGVLDELIVRRGVKVDIAVGTSTGAIQALAVAQDDVPKLVEFWSRLRRNEDVYVKKPLGPVGAVFGADSLYEARGLRRLLRAAASEERLRVSGKKLRLGVVSLTSGEFRTIDETVPGIHNWVYASCAVPVFFDPLVTRAGDGSEEQWVDGGVRDVTPLGSALELNPRGVLVIRAAPPPQPRAPKRYSNLVEIGLRALDILQAEVSANDTENAALINDLIAAREAQFRALGRIGVTGANAAAALRPLDLQLARYRFAPIRVIEPAQEFSGTLDFHPAKIQAAMAAGRQAVAAAWGSLEPLLS